MSTPHIAAAPGAFAPTVLLPGDPLRARHIAETYLEDAVEVTSVRNMMRSWWRSTADRWCLPCLVRPEMVRRRVSSPQHRSPASSAG